tara:strand:- start:525 stop:764 length:240 start_codon:yes stop_codon:yes gene_type:complete
MKTLSQWKMLVQGSVEDKELEAIIINSEPFRNALSKAIANMEQKSIGIPKGPEWPYRRAWSDGFNFALQDVNRLLEVDE